MLAPLPPPSFLTKILVLVEVMFTPSTTSVVAAPEAVNVLDTADHVGVFGSIVVVAKAAVMVLSSLISRYPVTEVKVL